MAEVFGIAAGAVGVASLSIQLAESLQKVQSFYASVKNAPLQIAELIEEIEIMQDILSDLESNSHTAAPSSNMKRCIKVAQRATKSFATFSEELQDSIKKRRYRGSTRFALSREDIKQMLDQLERTKSSLNLAYSLYQQATAEDRHVVVMQAVKSSQNTTMQIGQTNQEKFRTESSFSHTHSKSQVLRYPPAPGKRMFRVTTPSWLGSTILQFEIGRSVSGFSIFVRTYGIVPSDAPIFKACAKGDVVEMQRLFDSGLASPYDVDQFDATLWSEALDNTRIDSLRFLSQYPDTPDQELSFATFHRKATVLRLENELPHYPEARNLQDDIAWLRENAETDDPDSLHGVHHDPATARALRLLACPSADLDSVLFWQAHEDWTQYKNLPPFSEELAREMLSRYVPEHHCGKLPLQILAVAYGSSMASHLFLMHLGPGWPSHFTPISKEDSLHRLEVLKKTITLAISSGMDIHKADDCHTPMFLFFEAVVPLLTRALSKRTRRSIPRLSLLRSCLMSWLEDVQKAGVNLISYGAEEARIFGQYWSSEEPVPVRQCWHYREVFKTKFKPVEPLGFVISHGSTPEDWTIELESPSERYACEFWRMPGLYDRYSVGAVPGSWVAD